MVFAVVTVLPRWGRESQQRTSRGLLPCCWVSLRARYSGGLSHNHYSCPPEAKAGHTHSKGRLSEVRELLQTRCSIWACRSCDSQRWLLKSQYHQKSAPPGLQNGLPYVLSHKDLQARSWHQAGINREGFPEHRTSSPSRSCRSLIPVLKPPKPGMRSTAPVLLTDKTQIMPAPPTSWTQVHSTPS